MARLGLKRKFEVVRILDIFNLQLTWLPPTLGLQIEVHTTDSFVEIVPMMGVSWRDHYERRFVELDSKWDESV